ncbi:iron ABC transporter permease [Wandonia haliotis]|uniref:Iron ABC transporter permease n=1 Tax=Wandonia haliotis TaxID=574963 RepID=A0ABP3XXE5_9FLAO
MTGKRSNSIWYVSLAVIWFVILWFGLTSGSFEIGSGDLWNILQYKLGFAELKLDDLSVSVLTKIRIPRVILAAIVGASLSIAGAGLQGLFRNPLADPGLIGVSTGASAFAAFAIVLGIPALFSVSWLNMFALNVFTFIGALTVMFLAIMIAHSRGNTLLTTLLLTGIALNALGASITGLLTFLSEDEQLRNISFWMLGSLGGANWTTTLVLTIINIPVIILLLTRGKVLNALSLGEENAGYLGVNVRREKSIIIILSSLLVSTCVSLTGVIGFVGLVVPHVIRLLKGGDNKFILFNSIIVGSGFLILADTISRTIIIPQELPIGIITSLAGAPLFLYIIIKNKQKAGV